MEKGKMTKRKEKVVKNIRENYQSLEGMISKQLFMGNDLHGPTTGTFREEIWAELFQQILPKKFVIEQSAFIIDSKDGISKEIDLVIMDEMYTPYIFHYGKLKFIPIEAVAAVVECKSESIDPGAITAWGGELKKLHTATESVARLATQITTGPVPTQMSTRPIRILCALDQSIPGNIEAIFDFVLLAASKNKNENFENTYIKVRSNTTFNNLYEWFKDLNFYEYSEKEIDQHIKNTQNNIDKASLESIKLEKYQVFDKDRNPISLMTFNFQLNQLLMLINNPMMFPHRAYAKLFCED